MNGVLDKSALDDFLEELIGAGPVVAPVLRDQILCMAPVESADEVVLGMEALVRKTIARQASKELYVPRTETLFTYQEGKYITPDLPQERRIIFAVRPCDARGVAILDHVFDGGPDAEQGAASLGDRSYQDPYVTSRRRSSLMIGLACNQPLSTCFCTSVGGNPFSTEGLDQLWIDLGDRYLVEAITERGQALLNESTHLREAENKDLSLKAELAARAEEALSGPDVTGIAEKLDAMYDSTFWQDVHQSCLGCGACTYLCPTCHCFDIQDEGDRRQGRRVRNWDTCQFAQFTLHASGHNPRTSGKERVRQRIMHKFNYYVENFGVIACVGCGRCVRECPVNLDIRAVLSGVQEAEEG
jgi:ferredoxin